MERNYLMKHLHDERRLLELCRIEASLREHEFPPQLVVENTSYCNLKCIHCSHREMERSQRHMSLALWRKIVDEVGGESPQTELWPTFYGEALILGDELWDRLAYAHDVGCSNLVLNSNGTLLERNGNIDKILGSSLKRFILSLDGATKETFEKIRFGAKYDVVYPAVEKLLRAQQARGRKYPSIIVQFSVMKENASEVEAFRSHWSRLGAEVKLRPMLEWTATGSVRTDAIEHDTEFRLACPWGNNTMAVHQNGVVVACAVDYEGRFTIGNVERMSIREAWSKLGDALRRPHRDHRWNELPEICRGCGDWQTAGAQYEEERVPGTRPFWFGD